LEIYFTGLLVNLLCFVVMTAAYLSLFNAMRGGGARSEDMRVARKMALLIGTDALCWTPTLFFGL
jgi:hypothetical protein